MSTAATAREQANRSWLRTALLVALVYPAVGIGFALLDTPSGPGPVRVWRLAAWVASAVAFGLHVAYEHRTIHAPALRAAFHVAFAVALGGFLLAAWVNVHGLWVDPSRQSRWAPLALVTFPLVAGVPAFGVALAALAAAARFSRRPR